MSVYQGPGNPTHGLASTYRSPVYACRCEPCRDANTRLQNREDMKRHRRLAADPSIVEHGLVSTYINWGCRCEECTSAHSEKLKRDRGSRHARLAADPTIRPHGDANTYRAWGCRCPECVAAASEYKRARRAAS